MGQDDMDGVELPEERSERPDGIIPAGRIE
jgi:hypothetical protein